MPEKPTDMTASLPACWHNLDPLPIKLLNLSLNRTESNNSHNTAIGHALLILTIIITPAVVAILYCYVLVNCINESMQNEKHNYVQKCKYYTKKARHLAETKMMTG